MPLALAISPHLDDAVFSCGGTLAMLARRNWTVVMATVFTASVANPSSFALSCQTDKGISADLDYMAMRRAEDMEAAAALGISAPLWLPFCEAPHRGYCSVSDLFGSVRSDDQLPLCAAIADVIHRFRPSLVLGPLAIGGHVDHVVVRNALQNLSTQRIWLWHDFPYCLRHRNSKKSSNARAARRLALDVAARRQKQQACARYASQLGFQFGGLDGLDAALHSTGWVEYFHYNKAAGGIAAGT